MLTKQIEAFQTEYPYIKVNAQYIGGYNDIHTELASANAAGVGVPALCVINVPRLTSYAADHVVEDLNDYIAAFPDAINFDDFYPGMTAAMNNDEMQTALPFGQSGQIFYYNKTLLNDLGVTFPTQLSEMGDFPRRPFTTPPARRFSKCTARITRTSTACSATSART